uniref:Uncharacterized protein n=1 Tax=Oryza meridionalis TaxID=40149 RepID=A0A0E0E2S7_9ORYZ
MGGGLGRLLLGRTHAGALPGAWGLSGDDGCLRQQLAFLSSAPPPSSLVPLSAALVEDQGSDPVMPETTIQ